MTYYRAEGYKKGNSLPDIFEGQADSAEEFKAAVKRTYGVIKIRVVELPETETRGIAPDGPHRVVGF